MTTYRTAIRRGLAVRRTSHRPPRRGRKAQHGATVAPVAATVAATLAATALVRAGAALAKAEHDRRCRAQRARDRQFALLPGERLAEGVMGMSGGSVRLGVELLGA